MVLPVLTAEIEICRKPYTKPCSDEADPQSPGEVKQKFS